MQKEKNYIAEFLMYDKSTAMPLEGSDVLEVMDVDKDVCIIKRLSDI